MLRCEDLCEPNKTLDHLLSELNIQGQLFQCVAQSLEEVLDHLSNDPFSSCQKTEAASEHGFHQYVPIDNKLVFVLGE